MTDGGNLQPVTEALENVVPGLRVCCDSRDGLCRRWSAERDQHRDKRRQVMSLHFAMFQDLSLPSTKLMAQFILTREAPVSTSANRRHFRLR